MNLLYSYWLEFLRYANFIDLHGAKMSGNNDVPHGAGCASLILTVRLTISEFSAMPTRL